MSRRSLEQRLALKVYDYRSKSNRTNDLIKNYQIVEKMIKKIDLGTKKK